MIRGLLYAAGVLIAAAPAGVGVGVWLAVSVGWGVAAGSALYGAVGVWLLRADLPIEPPEAVR